MIMSSMKLLISPNGGLRTSSHSLTNWRRIWPQSSGKTTVTDSCAKIEVKLIEADSPMNVSSSNGVAMIPLIFFHFFIFCDI